MRGFAVREACDGRRCLYGLRFYRCRYQNTAGTKGLATCMNRTNGAVIVTATAPSIDGTQILKSPQLLPATELKNYGRFPPMLQPSKGVAQMDNRQILSRSWISLLIVVPFLCGCGSKSNAAAHASVTNTPDCASVILKVGPSSAVADHIATAPGNSAQFTAGEQWEPNGSGEPCAIPLYAAGVTEDSTWSVSDTSNVTISNTAGSKGLASCINRTDGPVIVTATAPDEIESGKVLTGSATLTCN